MPIRDNQLFQITASQSMAGKRAIPFKCRNDIDGRLLPGLTFSGSQLKIGKALAENDFAGSVTELGGGFYLYAPTVGETDTTGLLSGRVNKAGVRASMFFAQVVGVGGGGGPQGNQYVHFIIGIGITF